MSDLNVTYRKDENDPDPGDMPKEFDFSNSIPNPYYEQLKDSAPHVRVLSPDLSQLFPDDHAVDQALRQLVEVGKAAVDQDRHKSSAANDEAGAIPPATRG